VTFTQDNKAAVIQQHRRNAKDTGSPEVQVAVLTARIENINAHLQKNKHDFHSRQGLLTLVGQRRRLLNYLQKVDISRYRNLIEVLGLRK